MLQDLEDSINVRGSTELCVELRDRKLQLRPSMRRMTMSQTMDLPTIAGHMLTFTVAASSKEKVRHASGDSQPTERVDAHAWQVQWSCPRPDDIVLSASGNSRSITAELQQRLSPHSQGSLSCTAPWAGTPSSIVMRWDRSLPYNCACSIGLALPSTLLPEARWAFTARALGGQQNDKEREREGSQQVEARHRLVLSAKAHLSSVTMGAAATAKFKATPTDHFSLGVAADVTEEHVASGFVAVKTNFGKRTQAGLKVSVSAGGVVVTPWISRLKQKLHLPLSLAFAPTLTSTLLFTAAPLLLSALILRYIELPRRARVDSQAKAAARDESAAATEAKRLEAQSCVRLPPPPVYFPRKRSAQVRGAHPAAGGAEDGAGGRAERAGHREGCVRRCEERRGGGHRRREGQQCGRGAGAAVLGGGQPPAAARLAQGGAAGVLRCGCGRGEGAVCSVQVQGAVARGVRRRRGAAHAATQIALLARRGAAQGVDKAWVAAAFWMRRRDEHDAPHSKRQMSNIHHMSNMHEGTARTNLQRASNRGRQTAQICARALGQRHSAPLQNVFTARGPRRFYSAA